VPKLGRNGGTSAKLSNPNRKAKRTQEAIDLP